MTRSREAVTKTFRAWAVANWRDNDLTLKLTLTKLTQTSRTTVPTWIPSLASIRSSFLIQENQRALNSKAETSRRSKSRGKRYKYFKRQIDIQTLRTLKSYWALRRLKEESRTCMTPLASELTFLLKPRTQCGSQQLLKSTACSPTTRASDTSRKTVWSLSQWCKRNWLWYKSCRSQVRWNWDLKRLWQPSSCRISY